MNTEEEFKIRKNSREENQAMNNQQMLSTISYFIFHISYLNCSFVEIGLYLNMPVPDFAGKSFQQ